ncbi:MAG: YraN family protein [bacterium]
MNRGEVGRRGERLACDCLRRRGYRILATNHRSRLGELDIVCRDGETTVFVEVKTRTSGMFGAPAEAVDARKQERLKRLAEQYLLEHELEAVEVRFDVLAIRLDFDPPEIEHLEGAF